MMVADQSPLVLPPLTDDRQSSSSATAYPAGQQGALEPFSLPAVSSSSNPASYIAGGYQQQQQGDGGSSTEDRDARCAI